VHNGAFNNYRRSSHVRFPKNKVPGDAAGDEFLMHSLAGNMFSGSVILAHTLSFVLAARWVQSSSHSSTDDEDVAWAMDIFQSVFGVGALSDSSA